MPAEEVTETSEQYPDGNLLCPPRVFPPTLLDFCCWIFSQYFISGEEPESQDDLLGLAELTSDELKAAFRYKH